MNGWSNEWRYQWWKEWLFENASCQAWVSYQSLTQWFSIQVAHWINRGDLKPLMTWAPPPETLVELGTRVGIRIFFFKLWDDIYIYSDLRTTWLGKRTLFNGPGYMMKEIQLILDISGGQVCVFLRITQNDSCHPASLSTAVVKLRQLITCLLSKDKDYAWT